MTDYDSNWVRRYFDAYGLQEWNRWDASPVEQVKFAVHLHYLRQSVTPETRVLEMGAGAGRFTQELAKLTWQIVVADLSPGQLELNRKHAHDDGYANAVEDWVECEMCDLSSIFPDAAFDVIVCYGGPLSYVFDRRRDALEELRRVTRSGGTLLFSVMSLWGTAHQFLPSILDIEVETNRTILATGNLTPQTVGPDRHYAHLYRAGEFRNLLESVGLHVDVMSASNCLSTTWGERLSELPQESDAWRHLLEMELEACRQPGCLDMGTHMIARCTKPAVN